MSTTLYALKPTVHYPIIRGVAIPQKLDTIPILAPIVSTISIEIQYPSVSSPLYFNFKIIKIGEVEAEIFEYMSTSTCFNK